jgi:hypothetical protein
MKGIARRIVSPTQPVRRTNLSRTFRIRAERMATHPTLDERIHFVPDIEHGDGAHRLP